GKSVIQGSTFNLLYHVTQSIDFRYRRVLMDVQCELIVVNSYFLMFFIYSDSFFQVLHISTGREQCHDHCALNIVSKILYTDLHFDWLTHPVIKITINKAPARYLLVHKIDLLISTALSFTPPIFYER